LTGRSLPTVRSPASSSMATCSTGRREYSGSGGALGDPSEWGRRRRWRTAEDDRRYAVRSRPQSHKLARAAAARHQGEEKMPNYFGAGSPEERGRVCSTAALMARRCTFCALPWLEQGRLRVECVERCAAELCVHWIEEWRGGGRAVRWRWHGGNGELRWRAERKKREAVND
jgi:hypothetical protein